MMPLLVLGGIVTAAWGTATIARTVQERGETREARDTAGGALVVETFFTPVTQRSFTFEQQGVTVTVTANAGDLLVEDGLITPTDADAGLSIATSIPLDFVQFEGVVLSENHSAWLLKPHKAGARLYTMPLLPAPVGEGVGSSTYTAPPLSGLVLHGIALTSIRFERFGP
jgi:hypothetical protein